MSGLLLTDQERIRFADWLRREVNSHREIIKQMEKLPSMAPVIEREKQRAAAKLLVAIELQSIETMTVGRTHKEEEG